MLRVVASLMLVLLGSLALSPVGDLCESETDDCPPRCHLLCRDGCGTMPATPDVQPPSTPFFEQLGHTCPELAALPLDRPSSPEIGPPRHRA